MKCEEFSMKTLLAALKHQWKFMIIVVLIFALIGVGTGALFAEKGVGTAEGHAEALPAVSFADIPMNLNYYTSCLAALRKGYNVAEAYHNDIAALGNLTVQQEQSLSRVFLELKHFSSTVPAEIEETLSAADAVYVPQDCYEQYVQQCTQQLQTNRDKLAVAQTAAETIAAMGENPTFQTDAAAKDYDLLVSTAATAVTHMQQIQLYENRLKMLQDTAAVQEADVQMQKLLRDAADEFNALLTALCTEIDKIAKENHILYKPLLDSKTGMRYDLRHTHTLSTVQESFVLFVLFCSLVGVIVSIFFAIYRECKKQNKPQAA